VRVALSPLGGRAEVLTDVPFAAVKALNESAAIALVPSKWREPFGRTCLEAHAGGAAVISSGSGGLREISGEAALYVPGADAAGLARAVATLVADEALRVRLAAEGRARAENLFDLSRVAARLDDACEAVMRGAR
jgi:glycosyltransferase involved in cell wall biosynthesis